MLGAKKCYHCDNPMYIHIKSEDNIIFSGCEICVVNIKISKVSDEEVVLSGDRSTKRVRCTLCMHVNLIATFEKVKDGSI